MSSYIIVDTAHLYHRCRHVTKGDAFTKAGMALHIVFRSINKIWKKFHGEHIIFCLEGGSWRTGVYPEYKAHRKVQRLQMTPKECEEDAIFNATFSNLVAYLGSKTRCTVLHAATIEGDDFIARWVQIHANDQHVILSSDTDFVQLLAPNVTIYDGVNDYMITPDGVRDKQDRILEFSIKSNSKLKIGKPNPAFIAEQHWWRRVLFTKIMRGDSGDNIFSAYPNVRATKLLEAYTDRDDRGYAWNNLMLQSWLDHNDKEIRVLDAYRINEQLIDLTKQPESVKQTMDNAIIDAIERSTIGNVGIHFLRFCEQNSLQTLTTEAHEHALYLNAAYPEEL